MARLVSGVRSLILISSCLLMMTSIISVHCDNQLDSSSSSRLLRGDKLTKLHVYAQDILSGPQETVYEVARSSISATSATSFGTVKVVDDKLTMSDDVHSEQVGRVQGVVTSVDLTTSVQAMSLNFVFTNGEAKGSTLSILGRNMIINTDWEQEYAVVGGTGIFRNAKGYALAITSSYEVEGGHRAILYTFYLSYYEFDNSATTRSS